MVFLNLFCTNIPLCIPWTFFLKYLCARLNFKACKTNGFVLLILFKSCQTHPMAFCVSSAQIHHLSTNGLLSRIPLWSSQNQRRRFHDSMLVLLFKMSNFTIYELFLCLQKFSGPALYVVRALLDLQTLNMAHYVCVSLSCGIQKRSRRLRMSDLACFYQNTLGVISWLLSSLKTHAMSISVHLYRNGWGATHGCSFFSSKYMPKLDVVRSSFSGLRSTLLFLQISLLWPRKAKR